MNINLYKMSHEIISGKSTMNQNSITAGNMSEKQKGDPQFTG